jgi:hypothetical protein
MRLHGVYQVIWEQKLDDCDLYNVFTFYPCNVHSIWTMCCTMWKRPKPLGVNLEVCKIK